MKTALIVGLLTLLALDVCQSKAGGEKQGDGSRTLDADTKKHFDQRDHPLELEQRQRPCADTGCGERGGTCDNGNPMCNEIAGSLCGPGCRCCMDPVPVCPTDMCGTSQMGTCKAACVAGEFAAVDCNANANCRCCEPCAAGTCAGRCEADSSLCTATEYSDGDCGFGTCSCCKTCASAQCADAGGQCVSASAACPTGLSPNSLFACADTSKCKCCAPVCTPSSACADGHNPGRCVTNQDSCDATNEYLTFDGCGSDGCTCCKTCEPDYWCALVKGICVSIQGTKRTFYYDDRCPTGYKRYLLGTCKTGDCICCVKSLF